MTTHTTTFGGAPPRFTGRPALHALTAVLVAVLATAFAAGYAQDKTERSARAHNNILEIAKREAQKNANGQTEYQKGLAAYDGKAFEKAAKLFKSAAEKGHTDAMLIWSFCLERGVGTEKDMEQSDLWGKKSAEAGNPVAQAVYASHLLGEGEREEAFEYFERSVDQGCVFGMLSLAIACMKEENDEKAVEYLLKVASLPLTDEKNVLDYVLTNDDAWDIVYGTGLSATNGFIVLAQYVLGTDYAVGRGVEQDIGEAKKWLYKAAISGLSPAQDFLDLIEEKERGEAQDEEEDEEESTESGDGSAEFEKGLAAYEDEEFEDAVKLFRAAAEKGNVDAMIILSDCLDDGIGTDEDEEEAGKWLKKAADTGNALAQAMYGIFLMDDDEEEEAVKYMKRSAKQGCLLGVFTLGGAYFMNEDTEEEGFEILLIVARMPRTKETNILDHLRDEDFFSDFDSEITFSNAVICMAQYLVGLAYVSGNGVDADREEGMKWLRKAAKAGFKDAKKALGAMENEGGEEDDDEDVRPSTTSDGAAEFEKGIAACVDEEFEDAVKYFRASMEKGNTDAMLMYAFCLGDGRGIVKDEEESTKWLKAAADAGNALAQALHGCNLLEEDREEGIGYLRKSADQGLVFAMFSLGIAYKTAGDEEKSLEYLRKTALQSLTDKTPYFVDYILRDVAEEFDFDFRDKTAGPTKKFIIVAQFLVGGAYMKGEGVETDLNEALKWFRLSSENGFATADEIVELLEERIRIREQEK